ncbi:MULTISPECIES: hypothetical protein [Chroococcidiopsis]|nr:MULTISPECIES: hypothetical protein [Chroococcidiopsis]
MVSSLRSRRSLLHQPNENCDAGSWMVSARTSGYKAGGFSF